MMATMRHQGISDINIAAILTLSPRFHTKNQISHEEELISTRKEPTSLKNWSYEEENLAATVTFIQQQPSPL